MCRLNLPVPDVVLLSVLVHRALPQRSPSSPITPRTLHIFIRVLWLVFFSICFSNIHLWRLVESLYYTLRLSSTHLPLLHRVQAVVAPLDPHPLIITFALPSPTSSSTASAGGILAGLRLRSRRIHCIACAGALSPSSALLQYSHRFDVQGTLNFNLHPGLAYHDQRL